MDGDEELEDDGVSVMPTTIALASDMCPTRRIDATDGESASIFAMLAAADFSVGNFEMPLTNRGWPVEKLLNIRADPSIAADIPALGLDVVTLANNHAVDYGWDGLNDTVEALAAASVPCIGAGLDRAAASAPYFQAVNGMRVGVIPFSCLTPPGTSATASRPGIAAIHVKTSYEIDPLYQAEEPGDPSVITIRTQVDETDLAYALEVIGAAKESSDILIVSVHWGFGSGEDLAEYQMPLARQMIDAGADIIHGHHPHAIHAIGSYGGKPIIFGAGTLIGQQIFLPAPEQVQRLWRGMSPDGFITELNIEDGQAVSIWLTPTTLDEDRLPIKATGEVFDRIAARLNRLSKPYGVAVSPREGKLHVQTF